MAKKTANESNSLAQYKVTRDQRDKLNKVLGKPKKVGGTNILDLPRELRDEIYASELEDIRIIRAYSLQLPFPTSYFACGDPFRFLKIHPVIRDEWLPQLPILQNIEVRIDSIEQDNYKRAHPLVRCDDLVSPLEKVFTPWIIIYFDHALHEDATNPSTSGRTTKKANEIQLARFVQLKHVLEYAHKLLRGLNKITFAGDAGRYQYFNAPAPVYVPLSKDVNEIDPHEHARRLKTEGGMVPFWEHKEWKEILHLVRNWSDERIKEVSFERGFFSEADYEEEWVAYGMNHELNRKGLKATVERDDGENPTSLAGPPAIDDESDIFNALAELSPPIYARHSDNDTVMTG